MSKSKYVIYLIITLIIFVFTIMTNYTMILKNYETPNSLKISNKRGIDIELISGIAKENNVIIFTKLSNLEQGHTDIIYYTSSDNINKLSEKLGITSGKVRSSVYEDINISYKSFEELNVDEILDWSVYGSEQDISRYISQIKALDGYYIFYNKKKINIENYIPFMLCILLIVIMLLSSYFNAIYEKKEFTIRVIHGDSSYKYILKNILFDALIYLSVFFILYYFLRQYTVLISIYKNIKWMYIALCVLNCFAYFPLFKFNSREVIYGYQHTQKITSSLFIVKAISTIVVAGIITSMCVITSEIGDFYKARKFFESHKNYIALDFISDGDYKTAIKNNDMSSIQNYMQKEGERKSYLVNSQKYNYICITDIGIDSEYKVMYCNNRAMDYLQTVITELSDISIDEYDCIMLLPNSIKESSKEEYINYMKEEFESVENYYPEEKNIKLISYKPKNKILCMKLSGEFDYLSEPAICISSDTKGKYNINTNYRSLADSMLFEIDNTDEIEPLFSDASVKVIGYNAYEKYKSDFRIYITLIIVSLILLILMIIYYILIIALLIRFEYDLKAKELALKKVLGYSILRKNKNMFIQSFVVFIIILVSETIFAFVTKSISIPVVILQCTILFMLDISLLAVNIKKIEKKQLVKILKGGAL